MVTPSQSIMTPATKWHEFYKICASENLQTAQLAFYETRLAGKWLTSKHEPNYEISRTKLLTVRNIILSNIPTWNIGRHKPFHKGTVLTCRGWVVHIQYIPRNMHTVFALLCFVVVIHWLIYPYPSGLLHWHCGNLTIAPVSAKQPWWIWINTSCEFIMNDCITTTKQSTTKPCAYFLGYTVCVDKPDNVWLICWLAAC